MRWKFKLLTAALFLMASLTLGITARADNVSDASDTDQGSISGSNVYYFSYYYDAAAEAVYLEVTTKNGTNQHTFSDASDSTSINAKNPVCKVSMESALSNLITQGGFSLCTVDSLKADLNTLGYVDNGNGIWVSTDGTKYLTYLGMTRLPSTKSYVVFYYDSNTLVADYAQEVLASNTFTTLSSGLYPRTGYTFTGWNTAVDGSGTAFAAGSTYKFSYTCDLHLYAQWTDATAPTGSMSATPTSWSTGEGTVTITAQDEGSGLASIVLRRYSYSTCTWTTVKTAIYSGTTTAQTLTYSESSEGIFYYQAIITDSAGNSVTKISAPIYIDNSSPAITLSVTDTDWTNVAPTITALATDYFAGTTYTGSGIKSLVIEDESGTVVASEYNASATTLSNRSCEASLSYTLTSEYEGVHSWTIIATDFVGNIKTTTVTTRYDCTAPVIFGEEESAVTTAGVVTAAYLSDNIISQAVDDYATNSKNGANASSGLKSVIVYQVSNSTRTVLSRQLFDVAETTFACDLYHKLSTVEKSVDYYLVVASDYAGNIAQKKLVSQQSLLLRFRTSIDRSSYSR